MQTTILRFQGEEPICLISIAIDLVYLPTNQVSNLHRFLFVTFSTSTADNSKTPTQSSKNCETKCYTLKLGNTECKIICEPPQIEQPTASPAYNLYPQQAGYGQQYPSSAGQAQALPCVPPNCPPNLMYPPAPQYTGQGYSAPPSYPGPSQLIQPGIQSPVQEECVGRSCNAKNLSQSDKPADDKPVKQDKPAAAPSSSKPAPAAAPVTFQVDYIKCYGIVPKYCCSVYNTLFLLIVCIWRHGGHVGVQNNAVKWVLGIWCKTCGAIFYYMAVSSRGCKPRIRYYLPTLQLIRSCKTRRELTYLLTKNCWFMHMEFLLPRRRSRIFSYERL